jgi:hypothetical protein
MSVIFNQLIWLTAWEDFTNFNCYKNFIYYIQIHENDWMSHWLEKSWTDDHELFYKQGKAFWGYVRDKVKLRTSEFNTDPVITPESIISQFQILDVVVNKPFKDCLCHLYGEWLLPGNCPDSIREDDDAA